MYTESVLFSGGVLNSFCLRNFKLRSSCANKIYIFCTISFELQVTQPTSSKTVKYSFKISTDNTYKMQNWNFYRQHCSWPGALVFNSRRQLEIAQTKDVSFAKCLWGRLFWACKTYFCGNVQFFSIFVLCRLFVALCSEFYPSQHARLQVCFAHSEQYPGTRGDAGEN